MIYSHLKSDDLKGYPQAIRRALTWLRENDALALTPGRHDIEGADMYVMAQDVTTRPLEGSMPEAHARYIDLMYWPQAGERIGVARLTGGEPVAEESRENDFRLLKAVDNEQFLHTAPGDFLVLFPGDAHRPTLHPDGTAVSFRKLVMKIAVALID